MKKTGNKLSSWGLDARVDNGWAQKTVVDEELKILLNILRVSKRNRNEEKIYSPEQRRKDQARV